ncbi:MAG: N-acetyltransferase [Chloroflexi bacterium]|nr:N-acetyltransferase [Chloroflexota bacterium]MBP8056796.1 N-acetyltransferase [Chloroflexota bacterium]
MNISQFHVENWPDVQRIYQEGIETGNATFETQVPEWDAWDSKTRPQPRLVAHLDDQVVGWAALSSVSARAVYAGVCEVSVYVAAAVRGQGVGKKLLQALVHASEEMGIWTLQASIFPENHASIAIHEQCGFRILGRREKIAQHRGRWRDTVLMERRSQIVGVE